MVSVFEKKKCTDKITTMSRFFFPPAAVFGPSLSVWEVEGKGIDPGRQMYLNAVEAFHTYSPN